MKVVQLSIENFRGIRSACLKFDGHTLLVASNNVGKSTICEALDLVLGPDRLKRFPPIEEFDFYNAHYMTDASVGKSGWRSSTGCSWKRGARPSVCLLPTRRSSSRKAPT